MNISTISMVIFNSKLLVITRPGTIDTFKHRLLHLRSCDLLGAWHKGGQLRHDEGKQRPASGETPENSGKMGINHGCSGVPKNIGGLYIYNIYIYIIICMYIYIYLYMYVYIYTVSRDHVNLNLFFGWMNLKILKLLSLSFTKPLRLPLPSGPEVDACPLVIKDSNWKLSIATFGYWSLQSSFSQLKLPWIGA